MKVDKQLKKNIEYAIRASLDKGKVQPIKVAKFTKLFKGLPLPQAIQALSLYQKGLKREVAKTTLTIESVIPLMEKDIQKIKKEVLDKFTVLETRNSLNPFLLGGLKIKVGDVLIDISMRSRIEQIKEAIAG